MDIRQRSDGGEYAYVTACIRSYIESDRVLGYLKIIKPFINNMDLPCGTYISAITVAAMVRT